MQFDTVGRLISNTIKSFSVGYDRINKNDIFTSGDPISGKITLEVIKDCKIQSLCIKLKGNAEVRWSEGFGEDIEIFQSREKYFSILQFVIQDNQDNNVITEGVHVYPFTFQIPTQQLPSSFFSKCGSIQYILEASLSRPKRLTSKAKANFTFMPKTDLKSDPVLMAPQHSIIDRKMKLFNSGTVGMDVKLERTGFRQGEGIQVVASFQNKSSRDVKPKYCLYSKHSFFAAGKRKVETDEILKEVGDVIPPSAGQTVARTFAIPPDTCASILNCDILRVEYRLKVYLDVKYAFDPELTFPIVILPAQAAPEQVRSVSPACQSEEDLNCDSQTPPPASET